MRTAVLRSPAPAGPVRELVQWASDKLPGPVRDTAYQAAEQARVKTTQAGHLLRNNTPEPVREKAAQGARGTRENRTALLVAIGIAMHWLARRRRKGWNER